ncbi:MAG: PilZ domain-containing protein [Erysipelotrichales bacterium]|nr:PilZ domain-containing protein [Erysipelotrichales bacterium]
MFVINYKYEGASCEIKSFENEKIAIGKIYRTYAEYLWISTTESLRNVEKYEDMLVKVDVSHASLTSLTLMGKLSIGKRGDIKITNVELISENNQREYYRVNLMRDEKLNLVDKSGMINMQFNTKVIDISLGGALIESTLQLPIGRELSLNVEVGNDSIVSLKGVILRKPDSVNGKNRYGMKFYEHDQLDELVTLGMYLFRVQEESDLRNLY